MADTEISALTALTGALAADGDLFVIVDVSDTTMAASGTDKSITLLDVLEAFELREPTDHVSIIGRNFLP
jgi:hypothetical protein